MTNLIHIGSLTFDADPDSGSRWSASDLQGWFSSPPMRADTDDRPNSDGAFGSVKNYRSARPLRFVGVLAGDSVADAQEELFDAFAALQADGVPFAIAVENDQGTRTVTASLTGSADVEPDPDHKGASVTARFICYDPIKYGPNENQVATLASSGGGLEYNLYSGGSGGALYYGSLGNLGRLTLTNLGTAETWPYMVVTGTLTAGFYVQCLETGEVVRYDRVIPAGSTVSIDFRTGAVLVDGVSDASTYLTRDEFFAIPPGGSITVQLNAIAGSSGTPSLTVTTKSGWW